MRRIVQVLCLLMAVLLHTTAATIDQLHAPVPCERGPGGVTRVVNVSDTTYAILGAGGRFAIVDRKNRRVEATMCLPDHTAEILCIAPTNNGYILGTSNGRVWQEVNNEWTSQSLPSEHAIHAITVWRNKLYVAASDGVVWGLHPSNEWLEEYRAPYPLHDFVATQDYLFVVGDSSTIARTVDTQRGFDAVEPPDSVARFMCGVALGNQLLLGADKGTIFRYHVGTGVWNRVTVFHRFYDRIVRVNATRDLPGHIRALAVTLSGEVLATGSWLLDRTQGTPTEIVASSLDSGRSWMGYKLGRFVSLEQRQVPALPNAPYRDEQGVHIVHVNGDVCTNIVIDSTEKQEPPELWITPLRYHFSVTNGEVVARYCNNVIAATTENNDRMDVFRRFDHFNLAGEHRPVMLKVAMDKRDGHFREIRHDTMPWVSYDGLVQGGSVYLAIEGNVIVASNYPYESWDTVARMELPMFMMVQHPRGIMVSTIRLYQDGDKNSHAISQIVVVDRQGVLDTLAEEDTAAPSLVYTMYASDSGEVLVCRRSGLRDQTRFTMHRMHPSRRWVAMPDVPKDLTYASGPVMYRGTPVVYAWSQVGTGADRRFHLHALRLINDTDWEQIPVTVEREHAVMLPLQHQQQVQFDIRAVDTVHVLSFTHSTYITTHTLGLASPFNSTPGFGAYPRSAVFFDDHVVLAGDDELLGTFYYDVRTSVVDDTAHTRMATNWVERLQFPLTLRGYDVLGRLRSEHVVHSQSAALHILQGALGTQVLNNGRDVRYLVVER
jgi:hypothetical protein